MRLVNLKRLPELTADQQAYLEEQAGFKDNHVLAEEAQRLHGLDVSPRIVAHLRLVMDLPPEPGKPDPRHTFITNNPDMEDDELARRIQRIHRVATNADDVAAMRDKIAEAAESLDETDVETQIQEVLPEPEKKRALTVVPRESFSGAAAGEPTAAKSADIAETPEKRARRVPGAKDFNL